MNPVLKNLALQTGLVYDKRTETVCGRYAGRMISISQSAANVPLNIIAGIRPSASTPQGALEAYVPALKASLKAVQSVTLNGCRLCLSLGHSMTWQTTLQNARTALDSVAGFLNANCFVECCESCGAEFGFGVYAINGTTAHLCDACQQTAVASLEANRRQIKERKGNLLSGLVGALLGSLIGVAAFVLISQLGYIAAISGLIMAICAVKGYELLGGKFHVGGVVGICIILAVMVAFSESINLSIEVMQALELGFDVGAFFEVYRLLPALFEADMIDIGALAGELFMAYALTALGAVPTLIAQYRAKNGLYQVQKLA